jgi:hypothetical protein
MVHVKHQLWWDQVADYIKHDHCLRFRCNPERESFESPQISAQIPVYSVSSAQHGDDFSSYLTGYGLGDGLVDTGQITEDRLGSTEQEPQQYQVATIPGPMGSQGFDFSAGHMELFPLWNSYGGLGTLHYSGQPWLHPYDALPVDLTFGLSAEPPHT